MDAKMKHRMEKEGRSMKKGGEPGKDGGPAVSSLQEMVDKQVRDRDCQRAHGHLRGVK